LSSGFELQDTILSTENDPEEETQLIGEFAVNGLSVKQVEINARKVQGDRADDSNA
jgi:hypothetical protein